MSLAIYIQRAEYTFARGSIEFAFEFHGIEYLSFEDYLKEKNIDFNIYNEDDTCEYVAEIRLSGDYERLVQQTVKEVFHILFQNRSLLMIFNDMMASALDNQKHLGVPEDKTNLFSKPGVLKRKTIPRWVQRAVYFRDRGRCVLCDKDLSGVVNLNNMVNYDHIVPLARHGLNDVSNIQLLCKECNQVGKKSDKAVTSNKYQSWYPYDEI